MKKTIFAMLLCLFVAAVPMFAGVLISAAQSISNEVIQAVALIAGVFIILVTLGSMGSGSGRTFTVLIESAVIIFIVMNPNSIASMFRFGG